MLVVYFFISWHTLTSKHNKCDMSDDVEVLVEEDLARDDEDPYLVSQSMSLPNSSCEYLLDQVLYAT